MEKLELKHLAPYLPYEINIYTKRKDKEKILKLSIGILDVKETFEEFKPILRKLSDLTKEIEVNGEKFVPFDKIEIYSLAGVDYLFSQIKTGFVETIIYNMLLEWHFDVFGLIEKGLAIDINTLNK